jgi:L-lactate dehydrogenase complex protein LldF
MLGLAATHELPFASSLCGACFDVCPVKIPIPEILMRLRREASHEAEPGQTPLRGQGSGRNGLVSLAFRLWRGIHAHPRLYRLYLWGASRLRFLTPKSQLGWTASRTPLIPARRSLREQLSQENRG